MIAAEIVGANLRRAGRQANNVQTLRPATLPEALRDQRAWGSASACSWRRNKRRKGFFCRVPSSGPGDAALKLGAAARSSTNLAMEEISGAPQALRVPRKPTAPPRMSKRPTQTILPQWEGAQAKDHRIPTLAAWQGRPKMTHYGPAPPSDQLAWQRQCRRWRRHLATPRAR
jgi:hypothetical protein